VSPAPRALESAPLDEDFGHDERWNYEHCILSKPGTVFRYVRAQVPQPGIPIYAVMTQNEPLNSNIGYPTEYLATNDEATLG
jgi:hypothetical protein